METAIHSIHFYDKKRMYEVVKEANSIFRKHVLKPR
jgi:hypothetical protein